MLKLLAIFLIAKHVKCNLNKYKKKFFQNYRGVFYFCVLMIKPDKDGWKIKNKLKLNSHEKINYYFRNNLNYFGI